MVPEFLAWLNCDRALAADSVVMKMILTGRAALSLRILPRRTSFVFKGIVFPRDSRISVIAFLSWAIRCGMSVEADSGTPKAIRLRQHPPRSKVSCSTCPTTDCGYTVWREDSRLDTLVFRVLISLRSKVFSALISVNWVQRLVSPHFKSSYWDACRAEEALLEASISDLKDLRAVIRSSLEIDVDTPRWDEALVVGLIGVLSLGDIMHLNEWNIWSKRKPLGQ